MIICIDMGHTPASTGASGYLNELECDRALGAKVIAELERRGHDVCDSTPPDSMAYPDEVGYRSRYANARDIDLFVSLHLNAGGGTGTECLYQSWSDESAEYARRISANVAEAMGIRDRGIKDPCGNVGVIRDTNAPAVLLEACFVDNETDADAWHACPWDRLVKAICDGISREEYEVISDEDVERIASAVFYKVEGYKNERMNGDKDLYQIQTDAANYAQKAYKKAQSCESKIEQVIAKL